MLSNTSDNVRLNTIAMWTAYGRVSGQAMLPLSIWLHSRLFYSYPSFVAQLAGAVEYTDCFSTDG